MNERIKPITMESDAERAWRYGVPSVEHKAGEFKPGYMGWMFPDGSFFGHVCSPDGPCLPYVADRLYPDG